MTDWIGALHVEQVADLPVSILEATSFRRDAARLLSVDSIAELMLSIAAKPSQGDLIVGAGGLRKLRFGGLGVGKRGGVRVIYYYHSRAVPIFLLAIYGKGERASLNYGETELVVRLRDQLLNRYLTPANRLKAIEE